MEKIKIGNVDYQLMYVECVNRNEPRAGEIDFYERIIKIDKGMTEDDQKETLLHEVIHGISNFMDIGLEEEHIVRLSRGLAMVLRDNPILLKGG